MNFLNPLVLIGLIAASIPVLLHLLNLRKLRTVEFSSLKFLKELQKTKIKKLKLKQILLLILRTLIIIFVVLAFARPTIPGSLPFFESYSKSSIVILLDNSFSMDISDEYGNRYTQARLQVNQILSSLNEGDEVALIPFVDDNKQTSTFTKNFDNIKEKLSKIKISLETGNLNNALRRASAVVDDANNLNREIFIISDAQQNIFEILNNDTLKLDINVSNIAFIGIGNDSKADLQNVSVDSLKVVSRIFQKEKLVETETFIKNSSKNTISDVVIGMSFNGNSVSQRSSDLNSGETKNILISAIPNIDGNIKASIELESDIFDYDNKRYYGFSIPPKPRILTVESNPFLKLATSNLAENELRTNIKDISKEQLSSENLTNYDVVIINSTKLSSSNLSRLSKYLKDGGTLLLFPTDEINEEFSKFLTESGIGAVKQMKFTSDEPASFMNIDFDHPIFEGVFEDKGGKINQIETPKIIEAYPAQSARSLITMNGGAFLSEAKFVNGKILYFAVSPDANMSNFSFTGLFPSLIYRSILYLSSTEDLSMNVNIGNSVIYKLPSKENGINFIIIDPNGNESFYQAVQLPQGNSLNIDKLRIPGVYTILNENKNYVAQISANLHPSESNFTLPSLDIIEKELKSRFGDLPHFYISSLDDIRSVIKRARIGTELWQLFLVLALLAALAEMIVQRVSKNETGEN